MISKSLKSTIAQISWALVFGAVAMLAPQDSIAGPWTKSAGEHYVNASGGAYWANGFVNNRGELIEGVKYLGVSASTYVEWGFAERLQAIAYVPFVVATNTDADGLRSTRSGGGDATVGLQYGLPWKAPIALRATAKIPLYMRKNANTVAAGKFPVAGDGQIDATLWVSAGGGLVLGAPIYGYVEMGYQARTEIFIGDEPTDPLNYGDTFVYAAQFGVSLPRNIIAGIEANGATPLKSDGVTKGYSNAGVGFLIPFMPKSPWAVEIKASKTVQAVNSSKGTSASIGISHRSL